MHHKQTMERNPVDKAGHPACERYGAELAGERWSTRSCTAYRPLRRPERRREWRRDWEMNVAYVLGKGRKSRDCPSVQKMGKALDVYVNWARKKHRDSVRVEPWLGHEGPIPTSGIYDVVRDRGQEAGIPSCYPHLLRRLAAHWYLSAGGQESNLMRLMGWSSRSMVSRYAASAADDRARGEHKRLALGDQY